MRIAVLAAQPVPFFFGGAQRLCAALVDWLDAAPGHSCTLVEIPSPERDLSSLLQTYEECASLDLSDYDLVVSTKYPTWMVDHPAHVVYMIHPLRGLYETYNAFNDGGGGLQSLAHIDTTSVLTAVLLAIAATFAAGLYPAWRIGRIQPAVYLKNQ